MSRSVRFTETGGPDVLEIVDVPELHAGVGEVRVAVRSAGLNPFDSKVRSGLIPLSLPRGQGSEFAGVVDEVGDDVLGIHHGDDVVGWIASGAQSDFVVVPSTAVAPKPAALDWATAGGIGVVTNTARRATSAVQLRSDDTVLITGVAGGVGLLSAQFALAAGASVVGTAALAHHAFLRTLGVVPVAYGAGDVDRLRAAAPAGFSAALDSVGSAGIDLAFALGIPAQRINSIAAGPAGASRGISTVGGGKKSATELAGFAEDFATRRLVLPLRATFPLADVRLAYDLLDTGHGLGKIVLTLP